MTEKESLNFFARFYSDLLLLQGYVYPSLKKIIINALSSLIQPDISRSKDNQTKKLGHLIEYNLRNTFLEKPCIKCDEI